MRISVLLVLPLNGYLSRFECEHICFETNYLKKQKGHHTVFKPDFTQCLKTKQASRVQSNVEQIKKAIDIGQWVKGLVAELGCGMALFQ